jgi:hypothetical protein
MLPPAASTISTASALNSGVNFRRLLVDMTDSFRARKRNLQVSVKPGQHQVFVGLLFAGLVGYMFADRRFARAISDGSRRTLPALVVADSRTGGGLRQGGGGSPTEPPWLGWRLWGAPGSVESAGWTSCRCRWLIDRFELEGCEHAKRGVSALAVMEDLEVLEDRR